MRNKSLQQDLELIKSASNAIDTYSYLYSDLQNLMTDFENAAWALNAIYDPRRGNVARVVDKATERMARQEQVYLRDTAKILRQLVNVMKPHNDNKYKRMYTDAYESLYKTMLENGMKK